MLLGDCQEPHPPSGDMVASQWIAMIRVLFFVEPVVFREDPLLLSPWIGWIREIVRAAHASIEFGLASNGPLIRRFDESGAPRVARFQISQREVLEAFAFDRHEYAKDLFLPMEAPARNGPLLEKLRGIVDRFAPDVVVSFTPNRYLSLLRRSEPILFWDLGPLPRTCCPQSFFFDPCGQQAASMLVTQLERIFSLSASPERLESVGRIWDDRVARTLLAQGAQTARGLRAEACGKRLALFALQPHDWLTYEGAWSRVPPSGALMRWMNALPKNWKAVVTFHPQHRLPEAYLDYLRLEWPDAAFITPGAAGGAESLVPYVDAVVTISSSVGAQAVLSGKPLVAFGSSNLSALGVPRIEDIDDARSLSRDQRLRLLLFLTHRYCHTLTDLFGDGRYFERWLHEWRDAGFGEEFFLDARGWSENRALRLLTR